MRNLATIYPGKITVDGNNANGTFKNRVSDVLKDGTPFEEQWAADVWGLMAHVLAQLGIAPDGVQENDNTSQVFDTLQSIFSNVLGAEGLAVVLNAVTPATKIDIDADFVILKSSSGINFRAPAVNLTIDGLTGGANGIDTGAIAADNWYYAYVIYSPATQTIASLLSLSSTAPALPAGYTFSALVARAYSDSGSQFNGAERVIWYLGQKEYANVREVQPSLTAGGTFTTGAYQTRVLNTLVTNMVGVSLAANQLTLPANRYKCDIMCPAFGINANHIQLYNASDASETKVGGQAYSSGTSGTDALLLDYFNLTASKALEIRHSCQTTSGSTGFGIGDANVTPKASNNIYTQAEFVKQ